MNLTENERARLASAGDLRVNLPAKFNAWDNRRLRRFGLSVNKWGDDYEGCLFYNADLRSICGHVEEWNVIVINGQYWARSPEGFTQNKGSHYDGDESWAGGNWKTLLDMAESITVIQTDEEVKEVAT